MWNRESQKTPSPAAVPATAYTEPVATVQPLQPTPVTPAAPVIAKGSSLVMKGELSGSEDLVLEGKVEGKISLPDHVLTIGLGAQVSAEVAARVVILHGTVNGNVTASERVEIKSSGRMNGDLVSPKVQMADGATFSGRLETKNPGKAGASNKAAKSEMVA
jgi:cytoskeletal protein CcmA (bactofilin family)